MIAMMNLLTFKGARMRILFTIGLFLSFSYVSADIGQLSKDLNAIAIENEANTRSIEDARIKAADEKILLEAKIKELETAKANATKAAEKKVDSDSLNSVLLVGPIGKCKVSAGEHEREYVITNGDVTIRFIFAPFDSTMTPLAQRIKMEDGLHVIEIAQKKFTPERIDNTGEMSAVIRFEPESLKVIHATFRGQRLNDKYWGNSSSYATHQLTCIL